MIRKKKKVKKIRGSRTCGGGSHKKRRGAGNRGGRGLAGGHKHKWTWIIKYMPDHFGKYGFKRHPSLIKQLETINVGELEELVLKNPDKFEKENDKFVVDVIELGYEKVLGKGKVTIPMIVKAIEVSEKAKEKIEAVGGEVVEL
ncbi:uL15 family ribosomal protein [Methanocaldococcus fervens]|uniref:Large ribosomal subunit protein uL15 n=1 Tax=Methanocaldococcus fervens (strain DSM 4213 / JCM 15782 / AG86) TaxID=573064 RepID=C7P7G1_METFA|nr:uL15 family ribosomal protein [Methanocaldococcus fervens]ACV24493.1 ribosomal protein L15 [Methanocaldococcus fervens AG86]